MAATLVVFTTGTLLGRGPYTAIYLQPPELFSVYFLNATITTLNPTKKNRRTPMCCEQIYPLVGTNRFSKEHNANRSLLSCDIWAT